MKGTMRGICKSQAGPGYDYRTDLPIPAIGLDQVLLKVRATAVCGTDMHILAWNQWAASRMKNLPLVFGHETAGDIVEVGEHVQGLAVGQRISVETHIPCNQCFQCRSGRRHLCEKARLFGVTEPGAFAEYAPVPAECAVPLPEGVSYQTGALLEPMGAGVHGVERAQVQGKSVLISGCGPIGLMTVGACRAHGARKIIACDLFDEKLALARTMGADVTVNSGREKITEAVLRETQGHGADAALDISGSGRAITDGLRSLRKGGIFVSVGLPDGEIPLNLTEDIIYREITYTGISGRLMYETWEDCLQLLQRPGFSLTPVLGGTYPLEHFGQAIEAIRRGEPGKMLIVP